MTGPEGRAHPPGHPAPLPVLVVHEAPLLREALVALLRPHPGFAGRACDATRDAARAAARQMGAGVIVLNGDGSLPCLTAGIPALRAAAPATAVLVLAERLEPVGLRAAVQGGAVGYLTWEAGPSALLAAITQAARGELLFSVEQLHDLVREPPGVANTVLTPRETQLLQELARGLTVAEIAGDLGVTPHTVLTHLKNLMRKLDAHSRAEAVLLGIRAGLLPLEPPSNPPNR